MKKIKELIDKLNEASYAYYANDNPIMSDKKYDDLYDELMQLEKESGIILSSSPTQKVQGVVVDYLKEVKHTKPMLSANKTKDIEEIKKFIRKHPTIMSWKEDGLTVVLRYKNGIFEQAITRGGGVSGEDVTHTMRICDNIPLKLPYFTDMEVRGECVISWNEFERINSELEKPYMHPRNLAAGSVRQLNANILTDRKLTFKAFELVQDKLYNKLKSNDTLLNHLLNISDSFDYLSKCGFDVVEHDFVTEDCIEELIKKYNPEDYEYPVDGLIFEYNDYLYGKSLGETAKFPLNMIALKWQDELHKTRLTDVEWSTSKSGLINPVAVFEPTDLDGAITTKATLHNVTYLKNLQLGIGDEIQIYRANMVIPKVYDNITRSNTYEIPSTCPICGGKTEIVKDNDTEVLMCSNPNCKGKLLGKLSAFVSRNKMNIDGLSDETLSKFIGRGWLTCFSDIYKLKDYYIHMINMSGFGRKSIDKLIDSIEKSRSVELNRFIAALSIPGVGDSTSKDISKHCEYDFDTFVMRLIDKYNWSVIDGIGEKTSQQINEWIDDSGNRKDFRKLLQTIIPVNLNTNDNTDQSLAGKNFVVTGDVTQFKNRKELQKFIESKGGKVTGSVTSKTNWLINNDVESTSSKNKKAMELGIPIISEKDFLEIANV